MKIINRNLELRRSNGKACDHFAGFSRDFLKLYFELSHDDNELPFIELFLDDNPEPFLSGTFDDRYTIVNESTKKCLIKIGTAGLGDLKYGKHILTFKAFDKQGDIREFSRRKLLFWIQY